MTTCHRGLDDERLPEVVTFMTFDRRQAMVARLLGLQVARDGEST